MLCRSITLRVHGAVSICLLRCEKKEEEEEPVAHIGSLSIQHYIHILNNRLKKKRTNERKSRAAKQHHLLSRCFFLFLGSRVHRSSAAAVDRGNFSSLHSLPAIPMVFSPSDYIDNRIKYTWGGGTDQVFETVWGLFCRCLT